MKNNKESHLVIDNSKVKAQDVTLYTMVFIISVSYTHLYYIMKGVPHDLYTD